MLVQYTAVDQHILRYIQILALSLNPRIDDQSMKSIDEIKLHSLIHKHDYHHQDNHYITAHFFHYVTAS